MRSDMNPSRRRRRRSRNGWKPIVLAFAVLLLLPAMCWAVCPGGGRSVPLILQDPELPNGCETASLAMLLAWAGQPIGKVELYRDYLPKEDFRTVDGVRYGPDPEQYYAGDAASRTGG